MINYLMDEYDLYEEDAIDLIMEAYEEELYELNLFNILVEEYGFDKDEANELINETYNLM